MRSLTSSTSPSRDAHVHRALALDAREGVGARCACAAQRSLMRLALLPERLGVGVEGAVDAHDVALVDAEPPSQPLSALVFGVSIGPKQP